MGKETYSNLQHKRYTTLTPGTPETLCFPLLWWHRWNHQSEQMALFLSWHQICFWSFPRSGQSRYAPTVWQRRYIQHSQLFPPYLSIGSQHYVVRVAITDSQHISSHTAPSTWVGKVLHSFVHCSSIRVLHLEPLIEHLSIKGTFGSFCFLLYLGYSAGLKDDLNHAYLVTSWQAQVGVHPTRIKLEARI